MPLVQISLIQGRDEQKLLNLLENVTEVVAQTLDSPRENVRVIIQEIPGERWGIAGRPASEVRKIK
jgi:4-oxalocrotonate tautomerase